MGNPQLDAISVPVLFLLRILAHFMSCGMLVYNYQVADFENNVKLTMTIMLNTLTSIVTFPIE